MFIAQERVESRPTSPDSSVISDLSLLDDDSQRRILGFAGAVGVGAGLASIFIPSLPSLPLWLLALASFRVRDS